jgi:hypothetical protein
LRAFAATSRNRSATTSSSCAPTSTWRWATLTMPWQRSSRCRMPKT